MLCAKVVDVTEVRQAAFVSFATQKWREIRSYERGVKLLVSIDISTRAPWITQNEQHFMAGKIPHELDAKIEGH
jgi:hypothetical protein